MNDSNKSFDVLCAILAGTHEKGKIKKRGASIQAKICEIKKSFPHLFEDYIFNESGVTPYSEDLEQDLYALEVGGVLSTGNPSFSFCSIKSSEGHDFLKQRESNIVNKNDIDRAKEMFLEIVER